MSLFLQAKGVSVRERHNPGQLGNKEENVDLQLRTGVTLPQ